MSEIGCDRPKPAAGEAPPPPAVTVARPVSVRVQSYYEYNGYLEAIETVEIRARVKGYLNQVHFSEGDEIKPGDPLYSIDPREYQASVAKCKADIAKAVADMANARAQIKLAEADLERYTKLTGAASKTELDKATATLATNKAQLDVAAANKAAAEAALQTAELELGYTEIRSPIAGRISRTLVTRGNLVGQGEATQLTTIVSIDPLYVYFDVPEKDLIEYQLSLKEHPEEALGTKEFPVEVGVATEEGYPHRGVIDFREIRVDTGTGTVRIRGRVPNPPIGMGKARVLYPGLYSRVRVPSGTPRDRLAIPEDALMTGQEGRYVYVIGKESKIEKRVVTVGNQVWRAPPPGANPPPGWTLTNPKSPDAPGPVRSMVAIDKGLEPNDVVAVVGLQKARPGSPVTPEESQLTPPAKAKP